MDRGLVQVKCSECRELVRISTSVSCAECLCEWCTHSFVYLIVNDSIHLFDLALQSWAADAESLAAQIGFRFLDVEQLAINTELFELIPRKVARQIDAIAVDATPTEITVASPSPTRLDLFESLRFSIGRSVVPCLASWDAIQRVLSFHVFDKQDVKYDPLEDNSTVRPKILRAFKEAKRETDQYWLSLGNPSCRKYDRYLCQLYRRQKRLLEQEFGIAWSSPIELNRTIPID